MSDLISRQKALDGLKYEMKYGAVIDGCGLDTAYDIIEELPSAELERKKGKWIIRYYDMETYEYKEKVYNYYEKMPEGDVYCSECKESALLNGHEESVFSNFCPHCGAEMSRGE